MGDTFLSMTPKLLHSLERAARAVGLAGCCSVLAACEPRPRAGHDSAAMARVAPTAAPDADSIYLEAAGRFRAGLPRPGALTGGADSRTALVREFVRLLAAGDTAGLKRLEITRAEFAFLLYPESPLVRPPYRQAPDIAWMLRSNGSRTGLRRLAERLAGQPIEYVSHECPEPVVEGGNRYWRGCRLTLRSRGIITTARMFGGIVERGGTFKLESFGNDF